MIYKQMYNMFENPNVLFNSINYFIKIETWSHNT